MLLIGSVQCVYMISLNVSYGNVNLDPAQLPG